MIKLFKAVLFALIISCLAPVVSRAEISIRGTIGDLRGYSSTQPFGSPIKWLFITARNTRTGNIYQSKSDAAGVFSFENLEAGRYILIAENPGNQRVIELVSVERSKTAEVHLLAPLAQLTGNDSVDKFLASSNAQGGNYPAGNISYINLNDALDLYFMWAYFGILGLLSAYGFYRYRLIYLFLRYRKHPPAPKARFDRDKLPRVTVQL
ncbi:MAG: carboxypeptidase-like regulatory domain-containing protein, partial [Acidobacteriota bacterium]